jgi:glutamate--cysteine ligase
MPQIKSGKVTHTIACAIYEHRTDLANWFHNYFSRHKAPFYSSYDLRDSGFKLAPVDCNLFPAGFNNICQDDLAAAPMILKAWMQEAAPNKQIENVLIIPEGHTKNRFYVENLSLLQKIFQDANYKTGLGWVGEDNVSAAPIFTLEASSGKFVEFSKLKKESNGDLVTLDGFKPDLVICNNDFSSGLPETLQGINQELTPPPALGWHRRRKSDHFRHYNRLALELSELLRIDPWLFTVRTELVNDVDFSEGIGTEEVALKVEQMMDSLKREYAKRGIQDEPTVFIKNDQGTYGIGIHVVHSGDDVRALNRREKNKMSVGKGKQPIRSVIIQEGIPTQMIVEQTASEPVIYMFGHELMGGFIRSNSERGNSDNLNSAGMLFRKLCMKELRDSWASCSQADFPALEAVYGTVSRLSALAASLEIEELTK